MPPSQVNKKISKWQSYDVKSFGGMVEGIMLIQTFQQRCWKIGRIRHFLKSTVAESLSIFATFIWIYISPQFWIKVILNEFFQVLLSAGALNIRNLGKPCRAVHLTTIYGYLMMIFWVQISIYIYYIYTYIYMYIYHIYRVGWAISLI